MSFHCYLAGPISGLNFGEATNWREYAKKRFHSHIIGLSPMRGKDYLASHDLIGDAYPDSLLSNSRAINTRDKFDTKRADLILLNLLGAKTVSIGSMIEVGWASMAGVPIVLCMEGATKQTGKTLGLNLHDHAMLRECSGFFAETLDQGIEIVNAILVEG